MNELTLNASGETFDQFLIAMQLAFTGGHITHYRIGVVKNDTSDQRMYLEGASLEDARHVLQFAMAHDEGIHVKWIKLPYALPCEMLTEIGWHWLNKLAKSDGSESSGDYRMIWNMSYSFNRGLNIWKEYDLIGL